MTKKNLFNLHRLNENVREFLHIIFLIDVIV